MRKERIIQTAALFIIELMILLPVYAAAQASPNQTANATVPTGSAAITATAPLWVNTNYVDVKGQTIPNARIEYFVGQTKVKLGRSLADGSFETNDVPLIKKDKNELTIKAITDTQAAETKLEVNVDTTPPALNISNIPEITTGSKLTVKGDVSEMVRLYYTSYNVKDDMPPEIVTGLEARQVEKNKLTLIWQPSTDMDFLEYAVYRNGKRIATTRSTSFLDTTVASGKKYSYSLSAVDDSCNEGPKSGPTVITTEKGGILNETAQTVEFSCMPKYKHLDTALPFNITFDLSPAGKTVIEIIAEDRAGNKASIKKETSFDAGPPQFLWTNLDQLGTTYIPDITIKGNLSEKATVFVYINGKATEFFEVTDDQGNFEIKTGLKSDVQIDTGQTAGLNTGIGWQNKIALKAVDRANRESWFPGASQTTEVVWAECGFGSWVQFDPETITPSITTPRLLLQGIQQAGIPFKMKYIGGQKEASLGQINVVPIRLSPDLVDWFDNDKIEPPTVFVSPAGLQAPNEWVGYIQLNFAQFPLEKLDLETNASGYEKELAVSKWRQGEVTPIAGLQEKGARGFYFVTGCPSAFGCLRFYFEVDIPIREKVVTREPYTMQEKIEWVQRRQRACLPVTIEIDQVTPIDIIPEGLLKSSSDLLQKTIEAIDKMLDPLTQVTEYLLYSCAGSAAVLFLANIAEGIGCLGLEAKGVSKEIAKAGLCELYDPNTEDGIGAQKACDRCRSMAATYTYIKETIYQPICDRVGCPAAPTLQKYITDSRRGAVDLSSEIAKGQVKKVITDDTLAIAKSKYAVGGKLWGGNSCAFSDKNLKEELKIISLGYDASIQTITAAPELSGAGGIPGLTTPESLPPEMTPHAVLPFITGAVMTSPELMSPVEAMAPLTESGTIPQPKQLNRIGIKQVYEKYATPEKDYGFCNNLTHPAHPYCCGQEYMDEWNSACGIGNMLSSVKTIGLNIDTFSEIKQSTGLAAQKAGRASEVGSYGNIFNFFSGFCSQQGEAKPEMIRTGLGFEPPRYYAEENMIYMFVEPMPLKEGQKYGETFLYKVYAGYLGKDYEIIAMNETERNKALPKGEAGMKVLSKGQLNIIELADFTEQFSAIGTEKETLQKEVFVNKFCGAIGATNPLCTQIKAEELYKRVIEQVGTTDKEFIVKPSSGLWTSVQCICLPAIVGYLNQTRSIALAVKQCFDTILVNKDYAPGLCKAVLSRYVCDLLWEIISCFVNIWTKEGGIRARTGVFGEVLGVVADAGTGISKEIKGRYGETATFNVIFNEQELMHGLCFMAFNLDYELDISALTRASIEASTTDPLPVLFEICDRRFISYNPATAPKGLTTWEYHFGILAMAGQPSNVKLELVCSAGFNCNTDEYVSGECDCNRKGEQRITIRPTGQACAGWKDRLTSGDMLNVDCYHMLETQSHRFDKAVFTIEWQDSATKQPQKTEKECKINQIGPAPFFCKFDTFSLSYRCIFGDEPSGIRVTKIEPDYPHQLNTAPPTPVFILDDNMAFNMDIQQVLPTDLKEIDKATKFMTYKIKNQKGTEVASIDPTTGTMDAKLYELKTNGFYRKRIETLEAVSEDKFGKGKDLAGLPYEIKGWSNSTALSTKLKLEANRYVTDVKITYSQNGIPAQMPATRQFIIDINNNKFDVYVTSGYVLGMILNTAKKAERIESKEAGTYRYMYFDNTTNELFDIKFKLSNLEAIKPEQAVAKAEPPMPTPQAQPAQAPAQTPTPTPSPTPAPAVPKGIEIAVPAYLDKYIPSEPGCKKGYVSKGRFLDDTGIWGFYPYNPMINGGPVFPVNKDEYLQLCVAEELADDVLLDDDYRAAKDYTCKEGWTHRGWIINNLDKWAVTADDRNVASDAYLHLCVKEDKHGEFIYFGVKKDLSEKGKEREQTCKQGFEFKGHFALLWDGLPNFGWKFANAWSNANNTWKELSNIPEQAQYDWVGLCVKPVTIPISTPTGTLITGSAVAAQATTAAQLIKQSDYAQFVIIPRPGAAEDPCTSKQPVTWTATITILDADKYGQPTQQKAVDPEKGDVQEKVVAFQAACVSKDDISVRPFGAEAEAVPVAGEPKIWYAELGTRLSEDKITAVPTTARALKVMTTAEATNVITKELTGQPGFAGTADKIQGGYEMPVLPVTGKTYKINVKVYSGTKITDEKTYEIQVMEEGEPGEPKIWYVELGTRLSENKTTAVPSTARELKIMTTTEEATSVSIKELTGQPGFAGTPGKISGGYGMPVLPVTGKTYKINVKVYSGTKITDEKTYEIQVMEGEAIETKIQSVQVQLTNYYTGESIVQEVSTDTKNPSIVPTDGLYTLTATFPKEDKYFGNMMLTWYPTENSLKFKMEDMVLLSLNTHKYMKTINLTQNRHYTLKMVLMNGSKILWQQDGFIRTTNCTDITNCIDYYDYGANICKLDPCKVENAPCEWDAELSECLGGVLPEKAAKPVIKDLFINNVILVPTGKWLSEEQHVYMEPILPTAVLYPGTVPTVFSYYDYQYIINVSTSKPANVSCQLTNETGNIKTFDLKQATGNTCIENISFEKGGKQLMCWIKEDVFANKYHYIFMVSGDLKDILKAFMFENFRQCVTYVYLFFGDRHSKQTCPYLNFNFINIDGCARELTAAWDASIAADICLDKFTFFEAASPRNECLTAVNRIWYGNPAALNIATAKCITKYLK